MPSVPCSPPFRKTENFAFTEYFILDLDHLSEKGLELAQVRGKIQQDSRVSLCFTSPSQDGLKVFFHLKERCYDAGVFTLFYKLFAQQFARQYGIDQIIDTRTCDVARACFVSMDPQAYYNANAERVDIKVFVNTDTAFDFFDLAHALEQETPKQSLRETQEPHHDVDDDIMANIKAILNPNAKPKREKPPAYVPQQLESEMAALTDYIQNTGVTVTEILSIQYGKKIRTKVGTKMAETNVFYGKEDTPLSFHHEPEPIAS